MTDRAARRWRRGCAAIALATGLSCASGAAAQEAGSSPRLRLGGSLRTITAIVDPVSPAGTPADTAPGLEPFAQTELRITIDGRPSAPVAYELHLVQSHVRLPGVDSGGTGVFGLDAGTTRYRSIDATWDWHAAPTQSAALGIDRLNLSLALPRADITIGRQALTFGKAYFWNPLDVFLPFDARRFDRDYKGGVDALRVDVPAGLYSGFTIVAAAGHRVDPPPGLAAGPRRGRLSGYGSALLGRYFTTVGGWDVATQGGKVYGGYQLGSGIVGEIRTVEVRAEAAYLWASGDGSRLPGLGRLVDDALTAVVGMGRRFESSLTIEVEHLHNGAGEPANLQLALARFASGASLHLGREITGVSIGYDFLPILVGQLAALHSWSDASSQVQPTVAWSISDDADLLAGLGVNLGRRPAGAPGSPARLRSEFGSFPNAYFVEFKVYF